MPEPTPETPTATGDAPAPSRFKFKLNFKFNFTKKKLIILIAIAALVLLAGGAGAYFYFKSSKKAPAEGEGDGATVSAQEEEASAKQAKSEKSGHRTAPTFVPLEPFVVNLADKDAERYAQIGLTLEVDDAKFAEEMKLYMPAIRNAILMILAHKTSQELLDRAGKVALAAEIMREAVRPMGIEIEPGSPADTEPAEVDPYAKPGKATTEHDATHNPVRRVHFSSFIVQ